VSVNYGKRNFIAPKFIDIFMISVPKCADVMQKNMANNLNIQEIKMAKAGNDCNGRHILVGEYNAMSVDQRAIAQLQDRVASQEEVTAQLAGAVVAAAGVRTVDAVAQVVRILGRG